ncbi:6-hydroxypseudooxynicotine oxidase [Sphingobium estronivorans]|uniref:6-hydroxypseudooxynicotine oxidase n=1 Tax=Sphingobium estronivorans TaxID=1577690 RepID=UPI001F07161E|nr:6-hydroxypseudooxynicotine oxidase [Sphingobium estronivorans]
MRDPRYDILFEPLQIGPVRTKNRFYVVPHATAMGMPALDEMIAFRKARAEGGWGVVCLEETMIHETSDHAPLPDPRMYNDKYIEPLSRVVAAVKEYGALAGIELAHAGASGPAINHREHPLSPTGKFPHYFINPISARTIDRQDITNFRQWYRDAALRARKAGFDIIYVYCAHNLSLLQDFLDTRTNKRTDEYGGVFENRVRLLRETLSDVKDAVGDTCAVAVRFAVEDRRRPSNITAFEDGRRVVEALADVPDLWDVNVSDWAWDSGSSRFFEEGQQEPFIDFVKKVTNKPVVGVGRFTSPDAMVSQIKRGVLDLIGAARPSIADPFLPNKIDTGRHDDIRECIGCNACTAEVMTYSRIRCTQNPSAGEEHVNGWHPENVPEAHDPDASILVVGGGPAGLEAAHTLAKRGYQVSIADAGSEWGGRLVRERRMPRLSAWGRVVDYRVSQLQTMPNVNMYLESPLNADDIVGFGADHIIIATGAKWRGEGVGRHHDEPITGHDLSHVLCAEDILNGHVPSGGSVVVYDEDYYYMAAVIADRLAKAGCKVTYVTTASDPSPWTHNTLELVHVINSMNEAGIAIVVGTMITSIDEGSVTASRLLDGAESRIDADTVVLVTGQISDDELYQELVAKREVGLIRSVERIGDCLGAGQIAQATYDGRKAGIRFGELTPTG